MLRALTQDLGPQSVILTTTMYAKELVQADRCSVFLVDNVNNTLYTVSTDTGKVFRIPKTKGIAGQCATGNELISIKDAYQDERFNPAPDKASGYRTTSILAVPVTSDDTVLGVIQLINKIEFDGEVEEKFGEQNFRVLSEMRFLAKIRVAILDFCRVCRFFSKI